MAPPLCPPALPTLLSDERPHRPRPIIRLPRSPGMQISATPRSASRRCDPTHTTRPEHAPAVAAPYAPPAKTRNQTHAPPAAAEPPAGAPAPASGPQRFYPAEAPTPPPVRAAPGSDDTRPEPHGPPKRRMI